MRMVSNKYQQRPNEAFHYFMAFIFIFNIAVTMITPGSLYAAPPAPNQTASTPTTADQANKDKDKDKNNDQAQAAKKAAKALADNTPLNFEANTGQSDGVVKYLARGRGYSIFFTDQPGATLNLRKFTGKEVEDPSANAKQNQGQSQRNLEAKGLAIRMGLVGNSSIATLTTEQPLPGKLNYLIGTNASAWRKDVSSFGAVAYTNVYPNIDLKFYGNQQQLEYDFIVRPGGDVNQIALRYEGVGKLELTAKGELELSQNNGNNAATERLVQPVPVIYQSISGNQVNVTGEYVLRGNGNNQVVGFRITGNYNPDYPLVIDPVLSYSTYLGGTSADDAPDMVVDAAGNVYLTGFTAGADYPTTPGAYSRTFSGTLDAFVTKLSASGGSLIYSTFIGGGGSDYGRDIVVDSQGQVHITGFTSSSNFPTTSGARQTTFGGGANDAFVVKLNASGSGLLYSSYLGGAGDDRGFGVGVGPSGHVFVYGQTVRVGTANNFPTTTGAFRTTDYTSDDLFVARFNTAGGGTSDLVYSTYLGGTGLDIPTDLAVDGSGNAYATGYTTSTNYLTTTGALQTTYGGGTQDAFVTKLNSTGTALIYSTFLGGSGSETGHDLVVASDGTVYLVGDTSSTNFGTTSGAVQTTLGGSDDVFVVRLNAAGSARLYSTYLGGSGSDKGFGIGVDGQGNVYLSGITSSSTNFPTTIGAFQTVYGGGTADAFLSVLAASTGTTFTLGYSSYLGGSGHDFARDIAVDSVGNPYLNGSTASADFPVTSGAYQTQAGGSTDIFLTKFALTRLAFASQPSSVVVDQSITPPVTVRVINFANQVLNTYTEPISVSVVPGTGAADATLGGTTSANAVSGVVTFSNLSLNRVGVGYQLQAASGSLFSPLNSQPFEVITNVLTPILQVLEGSPQSIVTNTAFPKQFKVRLLQNGAPMASKTVTFTARTTGASGTFAGGSGSFSFVGTTDSAGIVTASVFTANGTVGTYNVVVHGQDVPGNTLIQLTNLAQRNDFKYTLSLTPALIGTMPVSGVVTLTAILKRHDEITLTNIPITFTVTDENGLAEPPVGRVSNGEGLAEFSYTRTITKSDKISAKAVVNGVEVYSSQAEVFWFVPAHKVSITPLVGRFFTSNADNLFTTQPGATPLFTQTFPLINFNPNGYPCPGGSDNPPSSQADFCTLPLTDVLVDPISGLPNDYLPVQGNGYVLGKGVFQGGGGLGATGFRGDGVLTGNLVFKESGRVVLHIVSDGSFYLGIGNGVTRAADARPIEDYFYSGRTVVYNSVFYNYPLVAANSWAAAWGVITVPLMIPTPGIYPFELDYTDGGGPAGLYIRDESGSIAARPVGSIKLVSLNPASQEIGVTQVHTLTAEVKDNANQPVNGLVTLLIERAGSPQYLTQQATNGTAVFTYTGTVPGSEQIQAFAWIRGQRMPSNIVTKAWTSPPNPPVNNPERPDIGCALNYRWISQPAMRASLSSSTQVSLANGIVLPVGTVVQIYPTNQPTYAAMITLTTVTTAIGTADSREIPNAVLDPTKLANGGYILRLAYLDTDGKCQSNLTLINVVGENKPGRVAFDVTDFTVPVAGMPIVVGRTYDSLERGTKGDFGYGWKLSMSSPKLEVNPAGDVTLTTLDGRRVTFFFTPGSSLFGFGPAGYTAEAGVYGSLTARDCSAVASAGGAGGYVCFPGGRYDPDGYTYRDPYGRVYNIERSSKNENFKLKSLTDLNGNSIEFSDTGIRARNLTGPLNGGANIVTFLRDSEGRIEKITDPAGKEYKYFYAPATTTDATVGDLVKVEFPENMPGVTPTQPISTTYTYYTSVTGDGFAHFFKEETDPRGKRSVKTDYYVATDNDPRMVGRLKSTTDALNYTTEYSYTFGTFTNTTKVTAPTNPATGIRPVTTSVYDSYGLLLQETDSLGRVVTYTYNTQRRVSSQKDPKGYLLKYEYDQATGFRTRVENHTGKVNYTQYNSYAGPTLMQNEIGITQTVRYDENFLPAELTDKQGKVMSFAYNTQGSILTQINGDNKAVNFDYDAYGNKTKEIDPLGRTVTHTYDTLGRLTTTTDPASVVPTVYEYDNLGRTVAVTNSLGHVVRYEYDANGNLAAEVDPETRRTSYEYDELDRLVKINYPDGTNERVRYNFFNDPISTTNQAGQTTLYEYDDTLQVVKTIIAYGTPDQATVRYEYDENGNLWREYDANNNRTEYEYDENDNLTKMTVTVGGVDQITRYNYDDAGRKISEIDPEGRPITFIYDERQRLVRTVYSETNGVQISSTVTYHPAGYVQNRTDPTGKTTRYEYFDDGQLQAVINPMEERTSYQYDQAGRLKTIRDANNRTTSFEYDALGRLSKKIWVDNSFESFEYDKVGNQKAHRLADGNINRYSYDNMNRLQTITYFDGQPTVQFTYTPIGQRETVTDGRGVTRYQYDSQNRVKRIILPAQTVTGGSVNRRMDYTYDAVGNRTNMATVITPTTGVAATYSTQFGYDELNRVKLITDSLSGVYSYTYNKVGQRTSVALPNGILQANTYSRMGYVTGITYTKSSNVLGSYLYQNDAAGNRTHLTEPGGVSLNWQYDEANRLLAEGRTESGTTYTTTYTYDPVGNRKTMKVGANPLVSYGYNELDQLITDGTQEYGYDRRGNLVQTKLMQGGGIVQTHRYDAADRLIEVSGSGGGGNTFAYSYDADGRRVKQVATGTNSQTSYYLWDELSPYGDVVAEFNGSGVVTVNYTLANGELLAQQRPSTGLSYYLKDGQLSTRLLANSTGTITDRYRYDAYGNLTRESGTTSNPYLYTGQQFDEASGLYSLRARYYNPQQGRFLSRDMAEYNLGNPVELNRYGYTANNPINVYDPSGLSLVETHAAYKSAESEAKKASLYKSGNSDDGGLSQIAVEINSLYASVTAETLAAVIDKSFDFAGLATLEFMAGIRGYIKDNKLSQRILGNFTVGFGVVMNINTGRLTVGVGFTNHSGITDERVNTFVGSMLKRIVPFPGVLHIANQNNIFNPPPNSYNNHAEDIVARWAVRKYSSVHNNLGVKGDIYRVLAISTSTRTCRPQDNYNLIGPACSTLFSASLPLYYRSTALYGRLFSVTKVGWHSGKSKGWN